MGFESFTDKNGRRWTACAQCNRGGLGNDPQKCACGWRVTELNGLGCFSGTAIVGEPRRPPKLTKAQENYQRYLRSEVSESFAEWMGFPSRHELRRRHA